ncbi:hypothetical protein GF352_03325 [archaeon]|nr:hypothetical protein [archaeon]
MNDENIDAEVKICEVCKDEGTDIVACRMCGVNFCGECGYTEKHLCYECGDEFEERLEDEADETLVESSEMEEEDIEEAEEI